MQVCVPDMEISFVLLCMMLVASVTPASAAAQVRPAPIAIEVSLLITVRKRYNGSICFAY